eukprot:1190110-Prorocentrum_minimum.AAC.6
MTAILDKEQYSARQSAHLLTAYRPCCHCRGSKHPDSSAEVTVGRCGDGCRRCAKVALVPPIIPALITPTLTFHE